MTSLIPKRFLARYYASSAPSPSSLKKWGIFGSPSSKSILDDDSPVKLDLSEDNDVVNRVRASTPPVHRRKPPKEATPEEYIRHRKAMRKRFPDGWNPPRKISREAMDGLRELHQFDRAKFNTEVLADKFKISPDAVRRILKGRWEPSRERRIEMRAKERKGTAEFVRLSQLRERLEAEKLWKEKNMVDSHLPPGRSDQISGLNSNDRFTFD
ncbi:uncharacterized protein BT62DRAFT_965360 [Guyanagaster necrorhizus]|uniref:Required for respiratory growth protein 9, mitochondrial n=1 Tax=Guyanagaster necrorhizus TaxID=856835 RepID=A0A9P8AWB6_9AGAR|nr:uncharacterized protein BT62DRAFT_965360 [Guyanagaster necrorhizus MCA 3950]KAG7448777.1 hypothetical protein BT62DRAFT_965360 [Guyanagaster necrorhizus MCA 3950]